MIFFQNIRFPPTFFAQRPSPYTPAIVFCKIYIPEIILNHILISDKVVLVPPNLEDLPRRNSVKIDRTGLNILYISNQPP